MLTGVEAIPIAGGGVGGAEGALMFVIKGQENEVEGTMKLVKGIKGATLPEVVMPDCQTCHFPGCYFAGQEIYF